MSSFFMLLLLAVGFYFLYKSYDGTTKTFNWRNGFIGIASVVTAAIEWFQGIVGSIVG